jgi:hypothetical protein
LRGIDAVFRHRFRNVVNLAMYFEQEILSMKMKLKATLLVVAVAAIGMAGNASAALQDAASGNSALIFSAWDPNTGKSYSEALSTNLNSFLPNGPSGSLSFAPDATFTALFGTGATLSGNTNMLWNVAAGDSNNGAGIGDAGTQFRLAATTTVAGLPYSVSQQNVSSATSKLQGYISQLNGNTGGCVFGSNTGSCGSSSASDAWNVNNPTATWGAAAGLAGVFSTAAGIGQSLFFLLTASSGTSPTTQTGKTWYLNTSAANETWTLQSDGTLVWSGSPAVSSVPVPAAVWLLGSGLMGLIGVARRRDGKKGENSNMQMAAA